MTRCGTATCVLEKLSCILRQSEPLDPCRGFHTSHSHKAVAKYPRPNVVGSDLVEPRER